MEIRLPPNGTPHPTVAQHLGSGDVSPSAALRALAPPLLAAIARGADHKALAHWRCDAARQGSLLTQEEADALLTTSGFSGHRFERLVVVMGREWPEGLFA